MSLREIFLTLLQVKFVDLERRRQSARSHNAVVVHLEAARPAVAAWSETRQRRNFSHFFYVNFYTIKDKINTQNKYCLQHQKEKKMYENSCIIANQNTFIYVDLTMLKLTFP